MRRVCQESGKKDVSSHSEKLRFSMCHFIGAVVSIGLGDDLGMHISFLFLRIVHIRLPVFVGHDVQHIGIHLLPIVDALLLPPNPHQSFPSLARQARGLFGFRRLERGGICVLRSVRDEFSI
mmetsp:Transcript_1311/g.2942  ORF Transcript_1311/g.2942 Transcript_1311/m.2942 type:complete len:122 (+) Transcript_1311:316-681(+)